MQCVSLGHSDLTVAQIGLGCMGMSEFYGPSDEAQLHRALELGVNLLDTADLYGNGRNECLLKKAIVDAGKRAQVIIATKFTFVRDPETDAYPIWESAGSRITSNRRVSAACSGWGSIPSMCTISTA